MPMRTCLTYLEFVMDKADVEKSLSNSKKK